MKEIHARRLSPPRELLDPEGEGIYLLNDIFDDAMPLWPGVLIRAAVHFDLRSGNRYDWTAVDSRVTYMYPMTDSDEWRPVSGELWKLRLNLPRRWRPAIYAYCTPKAGAM